MRTFILLIITIVLIPACKREADQPAQYLPADPNDNILMIANEGPFGTGSGSISRINISNGVVENEAFLAQNGFPLGNIVQSTFLHGDRLYTVVNNGQKVEVLNYPTLQHQSTIDGLGQPRYMTAQGNTGYISDWGVGGILVIDLQSNELITSIPTGSGPERMVIVGSYLFVANSGGFGTDNHVSVIDMTSNTLSMQIPVQYNPESMVLDDTGSLHVLCRGISDWQDASNDTPGAIVTIDPNTMQVVSTISFPDSGQHPSQLTIQENSNTLYFLLNGNIYSMPSVFDQLPETPLVSGQFYSIGFHTEAGVLVATDALDYTSNGKVHLFDSAGIEQAIFTVGVIPAHVLAI